MNNIFFFVVFINSLILIGCENVSINGKSYKIIKFNIDETCKSTRNPNKNTYIEPDLRIKFCEEIARNNKRVFSTKLDKNCFSDEGFHETTQNPCHLACYEETRDGSAECGSRIPKENEEFLITGHKCGLNHSCNDEGCCVNDRLIPKPTVSLTDPPPDPSTEPPPDPATEPPPDPSTEPPPDPATEPPPDPSTEPPPDPATEPPADPSTEPPPDPSTEPPPDPSTEPPPDPSTEPPPDPSTEPPPDPSTEPPPDPSTEPPPDPSTEPPPDPSTEPPPDPSTEPPPDPSTEPPPDPATEPPPDPSTEPPPDPATEPSICLKPGNFTDISDKSKYFQCLYEVFVYECSEDEIFDENTSKCIKSIIKDPDWRKLIKCGEKIGQFRNPYNCHKWYWCYQNEGDPTVRISFHDCPNDDVYKIDTCVRKTDIDKCHDLPLPKATDSEIEETVSAPKSAIQLRQSTESVTSTTELFTNSTNSESDFSTINSISSEVGKETDDVYKALYSKYIPCEREGAFRNPFDCHKFFRCYSNDDNVLMDISFYVCNDYLIFDNLIHKCVKADETSGCQNRQLPDANSDIHILNVVYE